MSGSPRAGARLAGSGKEGRLGGQTRGTRACARSRVSIEKATSFAVIKVLIFRDVVYMQDLWMITQKKQL